MSKPTSEKSETDSRPNDRRANTPMKTVLISVLLVCGLLQAQAGDIFTPNGQLLGHISSNHSIYSDTGKELGFLQGGYLYSPSGQLIGFVQNGYLYSTKNAQVLGYLQGNGNCNDQ
jgi:hypothetical protein